MWKIKLDREMAEENRKKRESQKEEVDAFIKDLDGTMKRGSGWIKHSDDMFFHPKVHTVVTTYKVSMHHDTAIL